MRSLKRVLAFCGLASLGWFAGQLGPVTAEAQPPKGLTPAPADKSNVVAYVNGQEITRQELGDELITRFGKQQLELLINRRIIHMEAQKHGITVTDKEVEDDISDVMKLGQFRTLREFEDHFLKKEKNCTLYEYKEDVVRPGIMMRKLAGQRLQVSEEEIRKAYDGKYGERVQCRVIFEQDKRIALNTYAEIIRSPQGIAKAFLDAAKRQANVQLAAVGGRANPIGRGVTEDAVEKKAFMLRDGEMSEVIEVKGGFVMLYREQAVPPDAEHTYAGERETLRIEIQEKKMRAEVPKIFKELRANATVRDYLNQRYTDGLIGAVEKAKQEQAPVKNQ
jgi:parvulin-like peptidyl-prolyl isomerase